MPSDEVSRLLSRWHRNFDPDHPLDLATDDGETDRAWYVPLDGWTDAAGERHLLRGPSVTTTMLRRLEIASGDPSAESTLLFAGFRGTGKTTELSRVERELRALGGFIPLKFRARDYHHMSEALSIEEMVLLLAAGIGEAAVEALADQRVERLANGGIWERAKRFLEKQFKESGLTLSLGPLQIKSALQGGTGFRQDLDQALRKHPDRLQEFLHDLVRELVASAHPQKLVIFVDELDKFQVSSAKAAGVYQAMADLFFHHSKVLRLPGCHTIYTIPPYLGFLNPGLAAAYGGRVYILPSVKVRSRPPETAPYGPGVAALREVIGRRCDLERLFGDAIEPAVERVAVMSGGQFRDLCNLMREILEIAWGRGMPVGLDAVENAIVVHRGARMLMREHREIIDAVTAKGDLESLPQGMLGALAGAMDQHLVLCYWNGDFWYDVHPLVRRSLESGNRP
jgi:hypothetical protein